jgi:hypothetical protein
MSKHTLLMLVVLSAIAVSLAIAVAVRGAHGSSRAGLSGLSNHGVRVTASSGARRAFRVESVRLLAVREGRAFYELDTADGRCFGVGPASRLGDPGGEVCPRGGPFPSASRPTLDFSVYEGRSADRDDMRLFRIEGFAADGVAAVGIANRAGQVGLRVPVSNNVYVLSPVPPGLTGAIVALDGGGSVMSGPDH